MKEQWTQEEVQAFNAMSAEEVMNVVSLAGQPVTNPQPAGVAVAREMAQLLEELDMLRDFAARSVQQLQDEVDESSSCGGSRPDRESLVEEGERLLQVGGVYAE